MTLTDVRILALVGLVAAAVLAIAVVSAVAAGAEMVRHARQRWAARATVTVRSHGLAPRPAGGPGLSTPGVERSVQRRQAVWRLRC